AELEIREVPFACQTNKSTGNDLATDHSACVGGHRARRPATLHLITLGSFLHAANRRGGVRSCPRHSPHWICGRRPGAKSPTIPQSTIFLLLGLDPVLDQNALL